ncbi:MAG: hypothetical protein ACXWVP_03950 [Burkholderiales bacterium]
MSRSFDRDRAAASWQGGSTAAWDDIPSEDLLALTDRMLSMAVAGLLLSLVLIAGT